MVVHKFRSNNVTGFIGHLQIDDAFAAPRLQTVFGNVGPFSQSPFRDGQDFS